MATPPNAACTKDRYWGHGVDYLGEQNHGSDLTGVASALCALGDDDVGTRRHMTFGVYPGTGQSSHLHPCLSAALNHFRWRRSEGIGNQRGAVSQGDVELLACPVGRERSLSWAYGPARRVGILGDLVALHQFVEELLVSTRDGGHQVGDV